MPPPILKCIVIWLAHHQAIATWLEAIGVTAAVAVALFQERIRRWAYHPALKVTASTDAPDFVQIEIDKYQGRLVNTAMSYYMRMFVANDGNDTARNVEVDAQGLRRRNNDASWERVKEFPPMNFVWSNSPPPEQSYVDRIFLRLLPAKTAKPCDIGHMIDPKKRADFGEASLSTKPGEASFTFELVRAPNNKGHIVGPGTYRLNIVVAAENSNPLERSVEITVPSSWSDDEDTMKKSGVAVRVL